MTLTLAPGVGAATRVTGAPEGSGVAVVVPVPRRADDLTATVEAFLDLLGDAGCPHTVVVVDDAGGEATGAVVDWLTHRHPDHVEAVRAGADRGTFAAVRAGAEAVLARTDHERVLLTDRDGAGTRDLAALLAEPVDADLVLGRGRRRSSPDAWVLVSRAVLERVAPSHDDVALAPELVAWTHDRGGVAVVRPATPAGARRRVTRRVGRASRARGSRAARGLGRWRWLRWRDPAAGLVTLGAAVTSVVAFLRTLAAGTVLAYPDADAHLIIARRVLDSPTPGITQLGAVWLPLPHLLALPAVAVDGLYFSGTAGALVSMAAFVLACRWLFGLGRELTGRPVAGVVAAVVFAACPNVLYLQSTPMTELPFLATIAGAAYALTRWSDTRRPVHLAGAALLALLGTLTRYEAWAYVLAMAAVVALTTWRHGRGERLLPRLRRTQADVVYFGLVAFAGVAGWILWNVVIFGDATAFYDGQFAKVALLPEDVADGSVVTTLRTYWYAVTDDLGVPLVVVGAVATLLFGVGGRLRPRALAASTPLVLLPFFLLLLYTGSRPLRVMEIAASRYNVRFGLIMIIPIAVAIGWLVAELAALLRDRDGLYTGSLAIGLVLVASSVAGIGGSATELEALGFRSTPQEQANIRASTWWRGAYTGGRVLMDMPGNETVPLEARLPTDDVVYDGNADRWRDALADPAAAGIDWIYMRGSVGDGGSVGGLADAPDRVWAELAVSPALARYQLVYDADDRRVYHRIGSP